MWLEPTVRSAGARALVGRGREPDADARRAGQRPDQADEGGRPVDAAELARSAGEKSMISSAAPWRR